MCVRPLCLLMSAQCLTCSLRKILFSVNLFVNLFVRQVCSFRLEHFKRHIKWLFEFNSWSAALWCMHTCNFYSCSHFLHVTVWEILNLLQHSLSHNSKILQLSQCLLLDSLKLNTHCNVCFYFIYLCTIHCAVDLWIIVWNCVKFFSASANCNLVAVQVI